MFADTSNRVDDVDVGASDEDDDDEEEESSSSQQQQMHNIVTNPQEDENCTPVAIRLSQCIDGVERSPASETMSVRSSLIGGSSTSPQYNIIGPPAASNERVPIALIDYILNVMKLIDAILSNNSTDDHCKEFILHGGLKPLLSILSLPNLPVTSCNLAITATAQAVATVCKSILVIFL